MKFDHLLLHTGPHRTGTTSFQLHLQENETLLNQQGYGLISRGDGSANQYLFESFSNTSSFAFKPPRLNLFKNWILSSETISYWHADHIPIAFLNFCRQFRKISVIFGHREPIDRLASHKKHAAKKLLCTERIFFGFDCQLFCSSHAMRRLTNPFELFRSFEDKLHAEIHFPLNLEGHSRDPIQFLNSSFDLETVGGRKTLNQSAGDSTVLLDLALTSMFVNKRDRKKMIHELHQNTGKVPAHLQAVFVPDVIQHAACLYHEELKQRFGIATRVDNSAKWYPNNLFIQTRAEIHQCLTRQQRLSAYLTKTQLAMRHRLGLMLDAY